MQPYWQYSDVPTNLKAGITKGATTDGVALLFNYNFKHGLSLALRPEYISASGTAANGAVNLLYGPGSNAFSFTFTPTWQKGAFFVRAESRLPMRVASLPVTRSANWGLRERRVVA